MCENCLTVLTAKKEKNNLINRKTRGGLIQPSDQVIKITRVCEKEIRCAVYKSKIFIKQKFNAEYLTNQILKQFICTIYIFI